METKRVVQLDARALDESLIGTFSQRFDALASALFFRRSARLLSLCNDLRPAIPILYHFQQAITKGQTPGQRLMGICFANVTRFKALAHYFLAIILPNALEIAKSFSLQRSRHHWWTLFNRISVALKLADLLYFLYFLSAGGPSRMVEKLLRLRSVYAGNKKPGIGLLNYSALNREMISDFIGHSILLVVPLLKLAQRHAKHIVARWKRDRSKRLTGIAAQNIKCEEASAVSASLLCAECKQPAIIPVVPVEPKSFNDDRESGTTSTTMTTKTTQNSSTMDELYCFYCFQQVAHIYGFTGFVPYTLAPTPNSTKFC